MDKTNYLLDKVSQIESELQLQAQINQDTQEKIDTNDKNIGSLQDKTSTLDTKVATLQDDLSICFTSIDKKVDKVDGKDLSTNDYDNEEKNNVANNTLSRHTHLNKTVLDDTTASFTTEEKTKLSNIENGANKNIQSDWSQTDTSADDYIKNKPTIPSNITLYSTTGQNTNGTMTQKATTSELNSKVNKTGSNIEKENFRKNLGIYDFVSLNPATLTTLTTSYSTIDISTIISNYIDDAIYEITCSSIVEGTKQNYSLVDGYSDIETFEGIFSYNNMIGGNRFKILAKRYIYAKKRFDNITLSQFRILGYRRIK